MACASQNHKARPHLYPTSPRCCPAGSWSCTQNTSPPVELSRTPWCPVVAALVPCQPTDPGRGPDAAV